MGRVLADLAPLDFTHLTAQIERGQLPNDEPTQRGRSLLFMGAGALLAHASGASDVYLNENGIMAVHLPVTEARIGSYSTKTAAPTIVYAVGRLASRALGSEVSVKNLLLAKTKPEVVGDTKALGQADALKLTASCWRWARRRQHCGRCLPCLMRRISFERHDIEDEDFDHDVFDDTTELLVPAVQDNLGQLCDQLLQIRDGDPFALELKFSELLLAGPVMSLSEGIDLYKRWSAEALDVLSGHPNPRQFLP